MSRFSLKEIVSSRASERPMNVSANSRTAPSGGTSEGKTFPFPERYQPSSSTSVLSATSRNEPRTNNHFMDTTRPRVAPIRILRTKDFKQIKLLGHGSGGIVVLVEDTVNGDILVMKAIEKKSFKGDDRLGIYAEQHTLRKLSGNPSFTELRGSFEDTRYFYLLMVNGMPCDARSY